MAEECQGLPLALKVIGRAMFGKTSRELQWEPQLKKLRESRVQERTVGEELYKHLKLGYDLLSEEDWRLEECFLFFAAFPEDDEIYFKDILWHWIGEGLVPGNGGDDPRADAFSLLKKLWERSFIESDEGMFIESYMMLDEEDFLTFKIHDVMRDLAFYIVENGKPPAEQHYLYRAGQNLEVFPEEWKAISMLPSVASEARRLSLHMNKLKSLPEIFHAPELVSLLLGGNPIVSLPASFLSGIPKLRVLDLSKGGFQKLPEELGDLKHLVCLDLTSCGNLEELPEAVGKLHVLKRLILAGCVELKYLPSGVVRLTSLQVLDTSSCGSLRWAEHTCMKMTPSGIAGTECLGHDPGMGASLDDICGLVALTNLLICGDHDSWVELPHKIFALTKLEVLELKLMNVETLPTKMPEVFIQLQELHLRCEGLEYLPTSFTCPGAFPALLELEISSDVVEFPEVAKGAFPKLRTLDLSYCESLGSFPEVPKGAFPKLRTLDLSYCKSLGSLPLSLDVLTTLRKLILKGCKEALKDACRTNCEQLAIWGMFDIRD
jgi:Leucine-rich repeat (LRR) protein